MEALDAEEENWTGLPYFVRARRPHSTQPPRAFDAHRILAARTQPVASGATPAEILLAIARAGASMCSSWRVRRAYAFHHCPAA